MADCLLFDEDEVCVSKPGKGVVYGLVVENSEYVSSDEFSDDEDEVGHVKRGKVRVSWHPTGKDTVVSEKELCLADRSLMPGDVVRRLIEGKDSQRGYVVDLTSYSHVKIFGTDNYIFKLNTKDLHPLQAIDLDPGDVTMDSWVGKIDGINKIVTLRFPDGARCEIEDYHLNSFEDVMEKGSRQSEFFMVDCFPDETLKGQMFELGSAKWIQPTSKYNSKTSSKKPYLTVTVVVEDVRISSVDVHWICKGFSKIENPLEKFDPPPEIICGDNLQNLQALETHHCSIQLGDRLYYVIKESDKLETTPPSQVPPMHMNSLTELKPYTRVSPENDQNKPNKKKQTSPADSGNAVISSTPSQNLNKNSNHLAENVDSSPTCTDMGNKDVPNKEANNEALSNGDVCDECQDADDESDESYSSSSESSNHSSASLPNQKRKLLKKKNSAISSTLKKTQKGKRPKRELVLPKISTNPGDRVPVDVCYTYSVATVMWQDGTVEKQVPSVDLFPIHHLDELEFFPGDYVVGSKETGETTQYGVVVSCDHAERTCLIKHMQAYEVGKATSPIELKPASEVSVYDVKDHPYYKFRPGHVVIRVGGFEKSTGPLEAAGLVMDTSPQGHISVRWADNSVSPAYPQELYIVGGDMSEMSSDSDWESESESDSSENASDKSWETEDEEVLEDLDSEEMKKIASDETNSKHELKMSLTVEKLSELGTLLARSQQALENSDRAVEDLSQTEESKLMGVAHIYLDIIKLCKHFDKIWNSSYFEDETLITLIKDLKREIRKGRSAKIVRHLSQVYASWKGEQQNCNKDGSGDAVNMSENVVQDTEGADNAKSIHSPVDGAQCVVGNCEGACNCAPTTPTSKTELVSAPPTPFSKARYFCRLICSILKDKMKLIQEEVHKAHLECSISQPKEPSMLTTENPSVTPDKKETSDTVQSNKPNNEKLHSTAAVSASMLIDDIIKKNILASEIGEFTKNSSPQSNCLAAAGDVDSMDNIIHMFVSNLSCLPDSCLTNSSDEAGILSRYGEVEDAQLPPETTLNCKKGFQVLESAPLSHKFKGKSHSPVNSKAFMSAVKKELSLLQSSLSDGIFVKAFEDRMDLFSIMIIGPSHTPYEDGLFFFEVQLPNDYPKSPPVFHYISFCDDRLNPNLYEDGKVCVSLLGTWSGKGNEVWTNKSNMLQVLISIQGLILVREPYYNEAGFEKQRGTQQGHENSKMYNEMAALKLTQSMAAIARKPPTVFQSEAHQHIKATGLRLIQRIESWVIESNRIRDSMKNASGIAKPISVTEALSDTPNTSSQQCDKGQLTVLKDENLDATSLDFSEKKVMESEHSCENPATETNPDLIVIQPEFPLLPASKGFCMTVTKHVENFRKAIEAIHVKTDTRQLEKSPKTQETFNLE